MKNSEQRISYITSLKQTQVVNSMIPVVVKILEDRIVNSILILVQRKS